MEFHRLWYGPREMPKCYERYGQTWTDLNGGTLTDHTDYRPTINGDIWDGCGTTFYANPGGGKEGTAQAVQRADIASYELLYEQGGIYLNTDMEARKPLGDLLDGLDVFLVYEVDGEYPSNAMMGATPEHPFVRSIIDLLPDRLQAFRGAPMNETTGPHLLRNALANWTGDPVKVFPSRMFMPYGYDDMGAAVSDDAYAEHHWGHRVPDEELWGD